jgi:hypothetical protein
MSVHAMKYFTFNKIVVSVLGTVAILGATLTWLDVTTTIVGLDS